MKRLIVTADDFGWSSEVNEAVVKAYKDGILRYASLMVNADKADEAARLAKSHPGLGIGLHLELCRESPAAWGLRYYFLPRYRRALESEINSQIEAFLSYGLKPTHVDGHFHLHVHPAIFPILAGAARRYGIPRIRLPVGEWGIHRRYGQGRQGALPRAALAAVFAGLDFYLRPMAQGLAVPAGSYGLMRSGLMSEDYVVHLIKCLPEGLSEIYFHPTLDPNSEAREKPTETHHALTEFRSLVSPRVKEALRAAGVSLVEQPQGVFPELSGKP